MMNKRKTTFFIMIFLGFLCSSISIYAQITSPKDISTTDLILWLDGQDPLGNNSIPANNSILEEWKDKSNYQEHGIQTTTSKQPLFSHYTIGGQSGVVFDGTDDVYLLPDLIPRLKAAEQATIFIVSTYKGSTKTASFSATGPDLFPFPVLTLTNYIQLGYASQTKSNVGIYTNLSDDHATTITPNSSVPNLFTTEIINDATVPEYGFKFYQLKNNVVSVINTDPQVKTKMSQIDAILLGKQGTIDDNGNYFQGSIAEIIVYNRRLTQQERKSVDDYLISKWHLLVDSDLDTVPNSKDNYPNDPTKVTDIPSEIPSSQLETWFDTSTNNAFLFNENKVQTWLDRSGKQHHVSQNTLANQPLFESNLEFQGDQWLNLRNQDQSSWNGVHYFIVSSRKVAEKGGIFNAYNNGTDLSNAIYRSTFESTSTLTTTLSDGNGNSLQTYQTTLADATKPRLTSGHFTSSSHSIYHNSTLLGSSNSVGIPLTSIKGYQLGRDASDGDTLKGGIQEVMILSGSLSDIQRNSINKYLITKWNISLFEDYGLLDYEQEKTVTSDTQFNQSITLGKSDKGTLTITNSQVSINQTLTLSEETGSQGTLVFNGGSLFVNLFSFGQGTSVFNWQAGKLKVKTYQGSLTNREELIVASTNTTITQDFNNNNKMLTHSITPDTIYRLIVQNNIELSGTLNISFTRPLPNTTTSYDLIDALAFSGSFDSFILPDVFSSSRWVTKNISTTGELTFEIIPFSESGILDFDQSLGQTTSLLSDKNLSLAPRTSATLNMSNQAILSAPALIVGETGRGHLSITQSTVSINGTLTLAKNTNSIGTLELKSGTLNAKTITYGQGNSALTLSGGSFFASTIQGDLTNSGSTINITNDISVQGNFTQKSGTIIAHISPSQKKLNITSTFNMSGHLIINLDPSITLEYNQSIDLFDFKNAKGNFEYISLPTLPTGLIWSTQNLKINGQITVTSKLFELSGVLEETKTITTAFTSLEQKNIFIGASQTGHLSLEGASELTNQSAYVGYSDAVGSLTINGSDSKWLNHVSIYLGKDQTGTIDQNDGRVTINNSLVISSKGTYNLNKGRLYATHIQNSGEFISQQPSHLLFDTFTGSLSHNGALSIPKTTSTVQGTLTLQPESVLTLDESQTLIVQQELKANGTLKVNHNGSASLGDSFTLFQTDSTSGSFTTIQLPTLNGQLIWDTTKLYTDGKLTVKTDFKKTGTIKDNSEDTITDIVNLDSRELIIGDSGASTANIDNGQLTLKSSVLGNAANSNGNIIMSGDNAKFSVDEDFVIGKSGKGTFTQTKGSVIVKNALVLGKNTNGTGIYNFNGGSLVAKEMRSGEGNFYFNWKGGNIYCNTIRFTLINQGSGQLFFSSSEQISNLKPETIKIHGDYYQSHTSTLSMNLDKKNRTILSNRLTTQAEFLENDKLIVSGLFQCNGILNIRLINEASPQLGDSYDLFDANRITGKFTTITLPELDSGITWNIDELYTTGKLTVSKITPQNKINGALLNYPNPFRFKTGTRLGYELDLPLDLEFRLYNSAGRLIFKTTFDKNVVGGGGEAGYNRVSINQNFLHGQILPAGLYIYVLMHENVVLGKEKMVVLP